MVGMRNVLVNGYFGIETILVWDNIKHDFHKLKTDIQIVIESLEWQKNGDKKSLVIPNRHKWEINF
jgi:uncharacterized protein with HEPN domain